MIKVKNIKKEYRIPKKEKGIKGSIKHLLRPVYETKEAVKGISFHIKEGESVAFIGTNGAGKSTTVKMLTGILKPTYGEIEVLGNNPFENRLENAKKLGVIFGQKTQLWWDIPIVESFRLLKSIYDIPTEQYEENIKNFCEILDLKDFLHQPTRKLSLGQRVRADMAAALLHNPPILLLDEPTIGLDIAVKQKVYEFLKEINKEKNTTILLTSHDIKDIESICNRLIILQDGEILFDDDMDNIYASFPNDMTLEQIVVHVFNSRRLP